LAKIEAVFRQSQSLGALNPIVIGRRLSFCLITALNHSPFEAFIDASRNQDITEYSELGAHRWRLFHQNYTEQTAT
jgi:hypothetical protein